MFSQSRVFACVDTTDSFQMPLFITILLVCLAFTLLIMLMVYLVKRIFFKKTNIYSPAVVTALIIAFIIGTFSSFLIPQYQYMFYDMGVVLPLQTELVISYRFLFWTPFIAAIAALIFNKGRQIQISWVIAFLCIELVISMMVIWSLYSAIFILGGC